MPTRRNIVKRLAIAAVVGVFALALLPVSASARLIGPALPISHDYHWATFDHGPGITSVASNMKAPFGGKITRVRLEAIEGNVKVQVIRRRNGRYTVIRESGWRGVNSVLHEVITLKTKLRVRKGNLVGLRLGTQDGATEFGSHATGSNGPFTEQFDPALVFGQPPRLPSLPPAFIYRWYQLLFNATIRH
jgi:hypothetical protein